MKPTGRQVELSDRDSWDFPPGLPGGPVVKTLPSSTVGLWVRSLVGELRFHMPGSQKNKI